MSSGIDEIHIKWDCPADIIVKRIIQPLLYNSAFDKLPGPEIVKKPKTKHLGEKFKPIIGQIILPLGDKY